MLKRNILLVEDDEQTSMIIKFVLNHAGYLVKTAGNGYDAIEVLSRYHFDLVILDINMPMMNGFEVLQRMRKLERFKDMPVLTLTVRNDESSIVKAKKLGADQYLVKPPEKDFLLKKVRQLVDERPIYKSVNLEPQVDQSAASMKFTGHVLRVTEVGMLMHSPIGLPANMRMNHLQCGLFTQLDIKDAKLVVNECKFNKLHNCYEIFFAFSEMSENHIKKIRDWVVEQAELKKAA